MSSTASAVCVVDTNVVVSGLISSDKDSPTVFVLDAMIGSGLVYLLSQKLLNEYSTVLRRPKLLRMHGLSSEDIDRLLTHLVANAMWREPAVMGEAPDSADGHLWALLATFPRAVLITGDQLLLKEPPSPGSVISPCRFRDVYLPDSN
ncbi:MAG: putative toxin-antitoxin system toxin component, PIN family [Gammaproteobacteria bacterium]|nr:putative toxin-antitoxin system toxin component, PIN family [Gammaproteobacteria bacterium]